MSLLPSRGPETSTRQEGEFEVVGVDEDVAPVLDALASDTAREVLNAIYEEPGTPSEIANRLDMSIQKVAYHLDKLEDVDLIAVAGTQYSEKGQEMTVYEPPDDPLVLFVGTEERKSRLRSLVRRVVPTIGALGFGSLLVQRFLGSNDSFLPFGGTGSRGGTGSDPAGGDYGVTSGNGGTDSAAGATSTPARTAEQATGTPMATDGGEVGIASEGTPTPSMTEMPQATTTPKATTVDTSNVTSVSTEEATRLAAEAAGPGLEPGLAFFLGGVFALLVVGVWWYYRTERR